MMITDRFGGHEDWGVREAGTYRSGGYRVTDPDC